ncbi:hypothetical protein [Verrucomicrobium spinosum]|uniref:hypothetical protein n=1 Tax=Verrucomicrobium spinosum TaxID=2736 RepID=UPI00017455DC|nr:hypothetical protein [Verrucomicrobium spinosum]
MNSQWIEPREGGEKVTHSLVGQRDTPADSAGQEMEGDEADDEDRLDDEELEAPEAQGRDEVGRLVRERGWEPLPPVPENKLPVTWPQSKGGGVSGPAVCGVCGAGRASRDVCGVSGAGPPRLLYLKTSYS